MKRRSFLAMLGLAPLGAVKSMAAVKPTAIEPFSFSSADGSLRIANAGLGNHSILYFAVEKEVVPDRRAGVVIFSAERPIERSEPRPGPLRDGDLWIDTSAGNVAYVYADGDWMPKTDGEWPAT